MTLWKMELVTSNDLIIKNIQSIYHIDIHKNQYARHTCSN